MRSTPAPLGTVIVVMGVSGTGKTTIGQAIAERIHAPFIDADDLHSDEARATMASGTPLTDNDRRPWLARVGAAINVALAESGRIVIACSALKRDYRDQLRAASTAPISFVHLTADPELIARRMSSRPGHFMPTSLLQSQLDTLEPLDADERGVQVDVSAPVSEVVAQALGR